MGLALQRRGLVDEYNGYQFRRESMAQDSAGKLISPHNARFESGPFGSDKAILVEEGTENLYRRHYDTIRCSIVDEASDFHYTVQLDTGTYSHLFHSNVVVSEDVITLSYEMRVIQGTSVQAIGYLRTTDNVVNTYSSHTSEDIVEVGEDWTKVSMTVDLSSTNKELSRLSWLVKNPTGQVVEVRNIQLEQKPYATTFTDGTRADEEGIIPTAGLLSPEQGTVEIWVKMPIYTNFDFRTILNGFNYGPLHFITLYRGDGRLYARYSSNGERIYLYTSVYNLPEWSLISLVYNDDGVKIYVNRELVGENAAKMDEQATTRFMLGASPNDGNFANGIIAHLRLSSIARTQEQLAPLDRPPEVDEYTTLYLPFNGPDNVRKAKVVTI